jgi:hypothetical protein
VKPAPPGLGALFDTLAATGIQVVVGRDEHWTT